jgi:prophage tail gpP-like protein
MVRQVAYESESHGVSIQGKGNAHELTGSVIPGVNGGNFSGPLISIVEQVLSDTTVQLAPPVGVIDGTPFKPPVHPNQGESKWTFLERLARDRDVDLANDEYGRLVLVGPHAPRYTADLIEGENIKTAQVVINGEDAYTYLLTRGQREPDDQTNGPRASEMESKAVPPGIVLPQYRPLLVPIEHPVWTQHEVDLRARKEARWSAVKIDVDVTVYGWINPRTGNLWESGTEVKIFSPMIPTDPSDPEHGSMTLSIQVVTFEQDSDGGTRTQLHLIEPWRNNTSGGPATNEPTISHPGAAQPSSSVPPEDLPPPFLPPSALEE